MLEVENKVLLESQLRDYGIENINKIDTDNLYKYFLMNGYNSLEAKYLLNACCMPYDEILNDISSIDTDSINFIYNMINKYGCKEKTILIRISDVLMISEYNKQIKRQF